MNTQVELPDMDDMIAILDKIYELSVKIAKLDIYIKAMESDITKEAQVNEKYFQNGKPPSQTFSRGFTTSNPVPSRSTGSISGISNWKACGIKSPSYSRTTSCFRGRSGIIFFSGKRTSPRKKLTGPLKMPALMNLLLPLKKDSIRRSESEGFCCQVARNSGLPSPGL